MSRIVETIDVAVPVRAAYDQWTQFEQFPRFMEGIDSVVQLDDRTLEWTATIAGIEQRWRARILQQEPDQVISWQSTSGARNDGEVRFESLHPSRTRVTLQLDVEPDTLIEKAGDALGFVERRVKGDMERFRDYIEGRGTPTGAWRGRVEDGETRSDTATSERG
jgi:uncharacterized membrane protein